MKPMILSNRMHESIIIRLLLILLVKLYALYLYAFHFRKKSGKEGNSKAANRLYLHKLVGRRDIRL